MNPILFVVSCKNALIFWFLLLLAREEKGHLFNWSGIKNHHAVSVSNPQIHNPFELSRSLNVFTGSNEFFIDLCWVMTKTQKWTYLWGGKNGPKQ